MNGPNPEPTENSGEAKRYDALAAAERLPEMVARIVEEFHPQRIIVFGSHARGEASRWSDIDLLVVFEEAVDKRHTAVGIQRILNQFLVATDVIVTDLSEISRRGHLVGSVLRPALLEGKVIYEQG